MREPPAEIPIPRAPLAMILDEASKAFGVPMVTIKGPSRVRRSSHARFGFVGMAVRYTGRSLPEIGHFIHRDHTTVSHARERFFELLADDEFFERAALLEAGILELLNPEIFRHGQN